MDRKSVTNPSEWIENRIYLLRGQKVMLSTDLAKLYGVETRSLLQAVRRNLERFPSDFMFQLTWEELSSSAPQSSSSGESISRSQFVILKHGYNIKYLPYAFSEQGVAMLSTVLRSSRAIQVNIEIMRAFVRMRKLLASENDLARRVGELEKKYDGQFQVVFDAIRQLMAPPSNEDKKRIGFVHDKRP